MMNKLFVRVDEDEVGAFGMKVVEEKKSEKGEKAEEVEIAPSRTRPVRRRQQWRRLGWR